MGKNIKLNILKLDAKHFFYSKNKCEFCNMERMHIYANDVRNYIAFERQQPVYFSICLLPFFYNALIIFTYC